MLAKIADGVTAIIFACLGGFIYRRTGGTALSRGRNNGIPHQLTSSNGRAIHRRTITEMTVRLSAMASAATFAVVAIMLWP
jgi:hypothetical protein